MTYFGRAVEDAAILRVRDTGPGIPAQSLTRVFDRFYRADPAHGDDVEGCGLGLSIAQWITSAHNGSVKIKSAPAEQTIVTVCLPLAVAT